MQECFDGDVKFHDCDNAQMFLNGGSDDAGFVQVMQGRLSDPERFRRFMDQPMDMLQEQRPEIIGGTIAIDDDGFFTETISFRSEEEARVGEKKEMPEDRRREFEEEMSQVSDMRYLDLHSPWFASRMGCPLVSEVEPHQVVRRRNPSARYIGTDIALGFSRPAPLPTPAPRGDVVHHQRAHPRRRWSVHPHVGDVGPASGPPAGARHPLEDRRVHHADRHTLLSGRPGRAPVRASQARRCRAAAASMGERPKPRDTAPDRPVGAQPTQLADVGRPRLGADVGRPLTHGVKPGRAGGIPRPSPHEEPGGGAGGRVKGTRPPARGQEEATAFNHACPLGTPTPVTSSYPGRTWMVRASSLSKVRAL